MMRFSPFTFSLAMIGLSVSVAACTANSQGFSDVSSGTPTAEGIFYLQDKGAVEGYEDGTFRPNQGITRSEFTKIVVSTIYSSAEIDTVLSTINQSEMPDVPYEAWFARFVNFARAKAIVRGYSNGYFKPHVAINVAEAAKIMVETFDLPVTTGDFWYEGYIRALANVHALPTSIGSLHALLSRGEMAEIVFRLQTGTTNKPSLTYEDLLPKPLQSGGCVRAGCSKELCVDVTETYTGQPNTCEWSDEYTCYNSATCERQQNGRCGWTQTQELTQCLLSPKSQQCATYVEDGIKNAYCATCGNGTCELRETCTSSSCVGNGCSNDCGRLYCPEDCDIVE